MVFARLLAKRKKLWSWQKKVLNMENKLTKANLSRQYSVADSESFLTLCRQGNSGPAAGSISATQPPCTWRSPLPELTRFLIWSQIEQRLLWEEHIAIVYLISIYLLEIICSFYTNPKMVTKEQPFLLTAGNKVKPNTSELISRPDMKSHRIKYVYKACKLHQFRSTQEW